MSIRYTLGDEIAAFLREHGPSTTNEVALGVRARRKDVELILAHGPYEVTDRPDGGSPRATYFGLSQTVPVRQARPALSGSQCDRVLAVLKDGQPHSMTEIHEYAGFMRLNSRVAELRSRGYHISCDKKGRTYTYQLHGSLEPASSIPTVCRRVRGGEAESSETGRVSVDDRLDGDEEGGGFPSLSADEPVSLVLFGGDAA